MEDKKLNILVEIFGSSYCTGDEHLFYCPLCNHHKPKLSINLKKEVYKCWVCDFSGRGIRNLIKKFGKDYLVKWDDACGIFEENKNTNDLRNLIINPEDVARPEVLFISLPEEFNSLTGTNLPLSSNLAQAYLHNRGITRKDILMWKIGYCVRGEYADRIIVPSFNIKGNVNYFIARSYSGDFKKYINPQVSKNDIIFNELNIDFRKPIVLVEGVFDAIKAGENSIPLLGSTLSENSKLFYEITKNNSKVYIALDMDAQKKEMRVINSLIRFGIEVYKIDIYPKKDVGEMTHEEFQERKNNAVFMSRENYLIYKIVSSGE